MNKIEGFITETISGNDETFFFGTLTFKLITKEWDIELDGIKEKAEQIKSNPVDSLDFLIDFMWAAYRANKLINNQKIEISKEKLWLWFDVIGVEKFTEIFKAGMEANRERVEKNPVRPQETV